MIKLINFEYYCHFDEGEISFDYQILVFYGICFASSPLARVSFVEMTNWTHKKFLSIENTGILMREPWLHTQGKHIKIQ